MVVQTRSKTGMTSPVKQRRSISTRAASPSPSPRRRSTAKKASIAGRLNTPTAATLQFVLFRGWSSLCFLFPYFHAVSIVKDAHVQWGLLVVFIGSMLWNNLAFVVTQSTKGRVEVPRWLVVFAAVIDGFGIVGLNLKYTAKALNILPGFQPWILAACWATYEYFLLALSQCPKSAPRIPLLRSGYVTQPTFIGYDGRSKWVKLHYPMRINVVRALCIVSAFSFSFMKVSTCIWASSVPQSNLLDPKQAICIAFIMVFCLYVGFSTYMKNGYDKDFSCTRAWVW